jgi:hypothetical protein
MKTPAAILLLLLLLLFALSLIGCITTTHPDGTTTRQLDPAALRLASQAIAPRAPIIPEK